MILLNRKFVRGFVSNTDDGVFLRLVLEDWNWYSFGKNVRIELQTEQTSGFYRVISSIRCPGGEPEAWIWLCKMGELPTDHPLIEVVMANWDDLMTYHKEVI